MYKQICRLSSDHFTASIFIKSSQNPGSIWKIGQGIARSTQVSVCFLVAEQAMEFVDFWRFFPIYSSVQKSGDFSPNQNRLLLICLNPSKPNIYGSYSTVRSDHTSLKVSKCSNLSTNVERHVNDHKTTLPKEN